MESTEQELRKLEKSTAKNHLNLAIGLFATSLIPDKLILALAILGAISALSSLYLILPFQWKRKGILKKITTELAKVQIEHVIWFLSLAVLGIVLIQRGSVGTILAGKICVGIGYGILIFGNLRLIIEAISRRRRHKK